MAHTIALNHKYKPEALHYSMVKTGRKYLFGLLDEEVIVVDKYGCLCGRIKKDNIHKPLRADRF